MVLFCFLCAETHHSKQGCVDEPADKFRQARARHGAYQKAEKYVILLILKCVTVTKCNATPMLNKQTTAKAIISATTQ